MEFDAKKLLEENLRLSKENNRLLHKMKRAATLGLIFRLLWISVLIGIPVALYVYIIQPYYESVREGAQQFQEQVGEIPMRVTMIKVAEFVGEDRYSMGWGGRAQQSAKIGINENNIFLLRQELNVP